MTTSTSEQPWRRGFWALIVTQFQGAFSDNALKTLVTFIGLSIGAVGRANTEPLVPLVGGAVLASVHSVLDGGRLSRRPLQQTHGHHRREGVRDRASCSSRWRASWRTYLLMALARVFLMGTHSAFFGPSKYGSCRNCLPEKRLSWGNGILELGTFLAIILGTAAGGLLFSRFKEPPGDCRRWC